MTNNKTARASRAARGSHVRSISPKTAGTIRLTHAPSYAGRTGSAFIDVLWLCSYLPLPFFAPLSFFGFLASFFGLSRPFAMAPPLLG